MIPLSYYLLVSAVLFAIGLLGVVIQRNAIRLLLSTELILNGANLNFVAFSAYRTAADPGGQVFAVFAIAIAAAEAAIGLAVLLVLYKNHGDIDAVKIDALRG